MFIDVVLNPAEIAELAHRDLSATTCVVFDVLRATSSMVTALAHGAAEIYPVCTIEEAWELKARLPEAILAGERHGERIAGFELGNSPFEFRKDMGARTLITTTTNGTIALRACAHARQVLVGAILNIAALARQIRLDAPSALLLVCAGTGTEFALEDAAGAGHLIQALATGELSDSAQAVRALSALYPNPLDALLVARNGRVLVGKGRTQEVEWCAQLSYYEVVAAMSSGVIQMLPR